MRPDLSDPLAWPSSVRTAGGHHYAASMWRALEGLGALDEVRRTPYRDYLGSATRHAVLDATRLSPLSESWTYAVVRAALRAR